MREAYEWIRDIIIALLIAGTILLFFTAFWKQSAMARLL